MYVCIFIMIYTTKAQCFLDWNAVLKLFYKARTQPVLHNMFSFFMNKYLDQIDKVLNMLKQV